MKKKLKLRWALAGVLLLAPFAQAQLTVPGASGADGPLIPATTNLVINLGLATTGVWSNAPAVAGQGVYDPDQWAVVYKYSSVNIAASTTVTFSNHPAMAPVVWLVNGNVTINGTINISGENELAFGTLRLPQGGPGGFRGAMSRLNGITPGNGAAYGPGAAVGYNRGAGSYSTAGAYRSDYSTIQGATYGNANLIPLIGGSGGLGINDDHIGTGGGGALLICASGTITLNGQIISRGGSNGSGGSGGAVRLVCNTMQGSGSINANGGIGLEQSGGQGRIRIECNSYSGGINTIPSSIAVPPSNPAKLWPDTTAPKVEITSVAGVPTPALISASMELPSADIAFTNTTAVEVVINSFNLPVNSAVTLQVAPKYSSGFRTNAAFFSGNLAAAVWKVTIPSVNGFAAMQVRAVSP
jgi:hypothetical protein